MPTPQQLHTAFLKATSIVILTIDEENTVMEAGEGLRAILGYDPEAVIGGDIGFLFVRDKQGERERAGHDRGFGSYSRAMHAHLRGQGDKPDSEILGRSREERVQHADGSILYVSFSVVEVEGVEWHDGPKAGTPRLVYTAVMSDVTEMVKAREAAHSRAENAEADSRRARDRSFDALREVLRSTATKGPLGGAS